MKKSLILFILAISLTTNSYAVEREWNMNLFDSNGWVRPFHIGRIFCDQRNNIWSEKCQDTMLEDIYGHIWPEVKQIILDFQKAVAESDYRYLKGKTVIPEEDLVIFVPAQKDTTITRRLYGDTEMHYLSKEQQIESAFLSKISNNLKEEIKNIKYEDINFDWWRSGQPVFNYKCGLRFKIVCPDVNLTDEEYICHYIPKIELIFLD